MEESKSICSYIYWARQAGVGLEYYDLPSDPEERVKKEKEIELLCEMTHDTKLYQKLYFKMNGKDVLTYQMNRTNFAPPYQGYYDTILQGYKDFNLNTKFLELARKDNLSPNLRNF